MISGVSELVRLWVKEKQVCGSLLLENKVMTKSNFGLNFISSYACMMTKCLKWIETELTSCDYYFFFFLKNRLCWMVRTGIVDPKKIQNDFLNFKICISIYIHIYNIYIKKISNLEVEPLLSNSLRSK